MHASFFTNLKSSNRFLFLLQFFPSPILLRFDLIWPPLRDVLRPEVTESKLRDLFDNPAGAEVDDHRCCEANLEAPFEGYEAEFLLCKVLACCTSKM